MGESDSALEKIVLFGRFRVAGKGRKGKELAARATFVCVPFFFTKTDLPSYGRIPFSGLF